MGDFIKDNDNIENESGIRKKTIEWEPFLKQLFIMSGIWAIYFLCGLSYGAPTVFIPQIRREQNDTIDTDAESWLSSSMAFNSIPWMFILSALSYIVGRKQTILIVSLTSLASFIVFYCSTTIKHLLISQVIQGPLVASCITINFLVTTEYVSPKNRGVFLPAQVATMFWGIWTANTIGTFSHWKNIGILGMICSSYTVVTVFIWPESPYWLSIRGKLNECAIAHRWIKGTGDDSEKELNSIMKMNDGDNYSSVNFFKKHTKTFLSVILLPETYKSLLLSMLTGSIFNLSGKMVCTMYSIMIIRKITTSETTAYTGMLILDGVTVFGMYLGCFLSKHLRRRTLLLSTCAIGIFFLLTMSLYLYLIKLSLINENKYVSISMLVAFSLAISLGPITLSSTIHCELLPMKSRSVCLCIMSVYSKLLMSIMLKITPYLFKLIGIYGTFLFFGLSSSVVVFLVYKYLPETKDKTLLEIAALFRGPPKSIDETRELMPFSVINKELPHEK